MKITDSQILYIIALSILLIISLIISFQRKGNKESAGRFLVIFFWTYWYTMLLAYIVLYKYANTIPHLIRTGQLAALIIFPASYFYVLQTLKPRRLRSSDLLHLLPALIYIIDYFPFFILAGHSKVALMEQLDATQLRMGYTEGWFMPQYGHYAIRELQFFAYCVIQLQFVYKVRNSLEHPVNFGDPKMMRWILTFVLAECVFIVSPLISLLFRDIRELAIFTNIGPILTSLFLGFYLVFQPEILYGTAEYFQKTHPGSTDELSYEFDKETGEQASQPDIVSEEALDKVGVSLEQFMQANKPYLIPRYKLIDLSNDTGIPIYKISAYVNRRKNQNFFGYLNQNRIDYFLEKVASKEYQSRTLEAMAEECGFQNRTTFIRVFKTVMGMTPTEYIHKR